MEEGHHGTDGVIHEHTTKALYDLYEQFLTTNKITEHTPLPLLQAELTCSGTTPQNQTTIKSTAILGKRQRGTPSYSKAFFMARLSPPTTTTATISSCNFDQQELDLLHKGLSFAPTLKKPPYEQQIKLLQQYNEFAISVRKTYSKIYIKRRKPNTKPIPDNPPLSAQE